MSLLGARSRDDYRPGAWEIRSAGLLHAGVRNVSAKGQSEKRQAQSARSSGGEVVRVGKNAKVSVVAERIVERFLERGFIELETVGAGAVNQAVKAAAMARQRLEPQGYSLVIVPEVVDVLLGHGHQSVVHLSVVDPYRM